MKRLIIVADDLAGAADCGVPFAALGLRTRAVLDARGIDAGDWEVLAVDTDSRAATAPDAAARVRRALRGLAAGDVVFKKVDSTLRGEPAAELGQVLAARPHACLIAAPAFPETGRTTEEGRQRLDGRPLEQTEFSQQGADSGLLKLLEPAGRPLRSVSLAQVRAGELAALVRDAAAAGEGLVCDAVDRDDLQAIAAGALESGAEVVWLGSAGLARALAACLAESSCSRRAPAAGQAGDRSSVRLRGGGAPLREPRGGSSLQQPPGGAPPLEPVDGPVLLVVGSPARATRDQLERLRQAPDCAEVAIEAGGGTRGHREAVDAVRACLSAGRDCALTLAGEGGARDAGPDGSAALAAVAARAAELAGGLVLTGGETARATLQALAVRSLTLAGEIQPGIALACADCARPLPLAIKAGGFGSPDALLACRRAMRREETVASDTEKGTASAR